MIRHPLPSAAIDFPEEEIRECAYYLWLEAGRPAGHDQDFWRAARERLDHSTRAGRIQAGLTVWLRWPGQKVRTAGQEARSSSGRVRLS